MALTLVIGGVRSGKSAYAEKLVATAAGAELVRYVATANTDGASTDPEWLARVAAHRARRPAHWSTLETDDLVAALTTSQVPTIVDDLGGWLTARLDAAGWDGSDTVRTEFDAVVSVAAGYAGQLVIVSPEVGLSIVPPTESGRTFQDLLGELNRRLAAVADRAELVVAGLPIRLEAASRADTPAPAVAAPVVAAPVAPAPAALAPIALPPLGPDSDPLAFSPIAPPSAAAAQQARERHRELTKPAGSLGRLEWLGEWIAACQSVSPPAQFERVRVVVIAGDHGVAADGVSAYPSEVTAQMVATVAAGGAAINVLADQAGASVRVEDLAVASDTAPELSRHKIRRSSGNIARSDALTDEETIAAIAAGRAIADDEVDSGADLLVLGDLGIGNTTPAAALIGTLTKTEPVRVVGRGTGIDDNTWMVKAGAVRDAMYRAASHTDNPKALLRTTSGADIAAMAGFLAQSALRRTPVVLDGLVTTAAALVAEELAPGAAAWWVAGHRSSEPAHSLALDRLQLKPILDLELRLGEGTGAALAVPLARSAVALLSEMATFATAGVSTGVDAATDG